MSGWNDRADVLVSRFVGAMSCFFGQQSVCLTRVER